ncbi:uncharacterized protein LODBEIA_P09470 [Lodderomyces beijingensis]|uniref:F-box domain-containing protein n=1 Tax=Lodderomyces beijingensis TaxID=1775926 RepID=A0ABP0ZGK6_9ASCO
MYDLNLLQSFPDEIIYNILDQEFLSLRDVSNFLFNSNTHHIAQRILNERCLAHICVGKRRNYESVITSSHDNEVKRGPHYWHIYYNFVDAHSFRAWLSDHHRLINFTIQIFIDQFQLHELQCLNLLQNKNLKVYLNWEDDDLNTVSKFTSIIWPSLAHIFDFEHNVVKVVLEYENIIDSPMVFQLDQLRAFEWRYYYSTGQRIELMDHSHSVEKIFINSMNRMSLDVVFAHSFPNLTEFIVKSPLEHPRDTCRALADCPHLKTLMLHSCYFGDVAGFLESVAPHGLLNLKNLELCNNKLGHIRNIDFASCFPSLCNLTIKFENGSSSNRFEFRDVVLPSQLKTLNLQSKRLHSFKVNNCNMSLSKLDLSYNHPTSFHFENFQNIKELNLSYNRSILSSIYRFNLFEITNFIFFRVEELHLQGCNINNEDLEALEAKYQSNPITSSSSSSSSSTSTSNLPFSNLRKLNLSNNKLTNLRCFNSGLYQNMKMLEYVDLSFNAFYYLNNANFPLSCDKFERLLSVNLTGNSRLTSVRLTGIFPRLETLYTPVKQNY